MAFTELSAFATNLSALMAAINTRFAAMRPLERSAAASPPTVTPTGLLWNRTDYPTLGDVVMRWNGSAWQFLLDVDFGQINAGGTVAFAANQAMGGFKITGLGAPTANGEAARYEDAYPTGQGRHHYDATVTVQTDAAPTTTFQDVGYVPRIITLRLYGEVRKQSDSSLVGSIDQLIEYRRWDADGGSGFAGTAVKTAVWSGTVGATTVTVYVEPKFTANYGFFLSIEIPGPLRCNVQTAQCITEYGLNT